MALSNWNSLPGRPETRKVTGMPSWLAERPDPVEAALVKRLQVAHEADPDADDVLLVGHTL